MKKYYKIDELINMIDECNKKQCIDIYNNNKTIFETAKGSNKKHQAWNGGYIAHLEETMNIAVKMYETFSQLRELPFSLSDALLVLYLHDLEKPWKYGENKEDYDYLKSFKNEKEFLNTQIKKYGFILTLSHINGLKYVHGEGDDYDPNKNIQEPLAAFVHNCDVFSARIWFNESKTKEW